jgi:hypothetical protein
LVCGNHQGQRSSTPRKQAGHKTASDKQKSHQKCLAKQEPSTQDKPAVRFPAQSDSHGPLRLLGNMSACCAALHAICSSQSKPELK